MDELETPVPRHRQARAIAGVLGVAVLVGGIAAGAVLIANSGDPGPNRSSAPAADSPGPTQDPTQSPTPSPTPRPKVSPNFDCGHGDGRVDIFTSEAPPIDAGSLQEQQALIERIRSRKWDGFTFVGAEPTHLGVVVLIDGDYQTARDTLVPQGVRLVAVSAEELGSVHQQVVNFLDEPLDHAIEELRHRTRDIAGYHSAAVWPEAGAVVVDWKAPIPEAVMAMAGKRSDGVNVIIQPSEYSELDITTASTRVSDAFAAKKVDAKWSTMTGCDDGSGLVVGIQPDSLGNRKAELESQLTAVAGMPVHVVAEEAPVPLSAR